VCKWGTCTPVDVTVPAALSYAGTPRHATKEIDSCIADIVAALNRGGVQTIASCCGHGTGYGSIVLADGRELCFKTPKP
jgi:hypothetical protein